MYAALDLGQRTIRAVLKRQDGKIVNELKIKKRADSVLKFLNGTNASVVMESGYNYQYLYDLLKSSLSLTLQWSFTQQIQYKVATSTFSNK